MELRKKNTHTHSKVLLQMLNILRITLKNAYACGNSKVLSFIPLGNSVGSASNSDNLPEFRVLFFATMRMIFLSVVPRYVRITFHAIFGRNFVYSVDIVVEIARKIFNFAKISTLLGHLSLLTLKNNNKYL